MDELRNLDSKIVNLDEISLTKLLFFDDTKYENKVNKKMLLASINFVLSTKRFVGQLMRRFSYMHACLQFLFPFVYVYFTLYAFIFYSLVR